MLILTTFTLILVGSWGSLLGYKEVGSSRFYNSPVFFNSVIHQTLSPIDRINMDPHTVCIILAMAAVFSVGKSLTIHCPVEGQVFTDCGSPCPPTCTNPNPFCIKVCVARCECPKDTVIDEVTNTCVPLEDCTYQLQAGLG